MRTDHFNCHVCLSQTGKHFYLRDARALIDHLGRQHFFCDEPACEGAMAAFATREELEQHARAVHLGRNMPRFDRRTARPLSLLLGEQHGGGGGGGGRGVGGGSGAAFPELPRHQQSSSSRRGGGGGGGGQAHVPTPSASGGFSLVDDDEQLARRHGHRREIPVSGYSNAAAASRSSREAFPALGSSSAFASAPSSSAASQPPPLVRVTSRCPCGRRASHQAVPLGTAAPALACDAACAEARRAAALADAFGVDRRSHVPVFERAGSSFAGGSAATAGASPSSAACPFRPGSFEPELLHWAWHHRAACAAVERALAEFVSSRARRREPLPALPSADDRRAVHMLARHYGLASQSSGEGSKRRVELFKIGGGGGGSTAVGGGGNGTGGFHGESSSSLSNPASSNDGFFPPSLLSTTANRLTLADVERAGNEARGYALCLVDVEPRADLSYLLRRFAESGLLKAIEGPDERGSATVRFTKAAGLREALDQLGGGMRGAFRIDRTATLRANEAVLGIPATSSAAAAAAPAGAAPAPPSSIYSDLDPHDRMAAIEAAFSSTSVSGSRGGARSNANARGGGGGGPSSSSSGNVNNASFRPSAAAVAAAAAELGNGWKLASDFDWADDE